jgi:hypothetical protein
MSLTRRSPDDFAREMAERRLASNNGLDGAATVEQLVEQHNLNGSGHVDDDQTIAFGIAAAERLANGHAWKDWVVVGKALAVGRKDAMRRANTNRPKGRGYDVAMSDWLKRHPQIARVVADSGTRGRLLDLIDRLETIEAWRQTLPLNKRLQLNHPRRVYDAWKKSTVVPDPDKQSKPSATAKLKLSVAELSEENARLKASGGNLFTAKDRAIDVVRILVSMFSPYKLTEIRKLLSKEIKQ